MIFGPISALPALIVPLFAAATCFALQRFAPDAARAGRFATIDGLRGYLALSVYLSHGCLWYFYLRNGFWVTPPSHLYSHLGQSSVAIFFMITGFLFISKLLDSGAGDVDWQRLFVARALRLAPLYLVAVSLMLGIVAYMSKGVLREPVALLIKHVVEWLAFTVIGGPDLNGVKNTAVITAGVTWSLQYEWVFYGSLPIFALCLGKTPPPAYVVCGLAVALAFSFLLHPNFYNLLSFGGGIAAAPLARSARFCRLAGTHIASLLIVGAIVAAVVAHPSTYAAWPIALLSVAFVLIACGNSLFGLLLHDISRVLGKLTYGLYLLHGIVLFVVFDCILGAERSRQLSSTQHWWLVIGITPALLLVCFAAHRLIERPAMASTPTVMAWLRRDTGRQAARPISDSA